MTRRTTMIEDYIPVKEISYAGVREKMGGHYLSKGQIRNLHLWWARRPLAACRAAVYATFAPPVTAEDREDLPAFFEQLCDYRGPILPETPALLAARDVVSQAGPAGSRPRVLDLFAGGGAIPLEALRLGADVVALDLNPVAHLIERCCLEFPQRYGKRLRDAVETWGTWVVEQTKAEVGDLYPDIVLTETAASRQEDLFAAHRGGIRKLRPIAWLWTRTIPSTARGFERGMVPLVRQTWLSKGAGAFVALRPVVDREALTVRFDLVTSRARTEAEAVRDWDFDPTGETARGTTTCPYSGNPITADDAKRAGVAGAMGAQFMAVVCVEEGERGKVFLDASMIGSHRLPEDAAIRARIADLTRETKVSIPDEPLPADDTRWFQPTVYGMETYGKLFTSRQLLTLLTFCKQVRAAHVRLLAESGDADFSAAVAAYLGLLVGRVADRSSTLCRWRGDGRNETENTFSRQALPMIWDYSESNPFGGSSGDARMQLDYHVEVIDHCAAAAPGRPAEVVRGRAQAVPLADESMDAVITDPPYYDNISYADLSDFFYVWHKRALEKIFPAIYGTTVTPKKAEAVVAPQRHGKGVQGKAAATIFYEAAMAEAFAECRRVLKPGAPLVVVYAHKTTLGWSTLVDALRSGGFEVTEAWPLATEMPGKVGWQVAAMLASSIFLVARKRGEGGVGNYATEVRPEMVGIVAERVHDLMAVGLTGADLVIAAVGAGLRPFTRFDAVELPNGEPLPSQRFLDEVQREVLEAVLSEVFEVDRAGVGQVDQVSRFYVLARYQYGEVEVEFGTMNVLAQGLGIELTGAGSLSDGPRAVISQKKSIFSVRGFEERGADPLLGLPVHGADPSLVDVLHRLLWLMDQDRAKVMPFLAEAHTDLGRLKLLANALKGRTLADSREGDTRTNEQKAVDRLLAQWSRLAESRDQGPLFAGGR